MCIVFHEISWFSSFLNLLVLELNVKCCYGCDRFTHPLGREDKSRVKSLVGLEV